MITVSTIVERFNVSPNAVRHYRKLGLLSPERDPVNGYHRYRRQDESSLRFIMSARKLGFRLKEIQKIILVAQDGATPFPLVRELIEQGVQNARQEILDAQIVITEMAKVKEHRQHLSDQAPWGASVCRLIDVWGDLTKAPSTTSERSHLS